MILLFTLAGCTFPLVPCEGDAECINAFGVGYTCDEATGTCVEPRPDTTPTDTTPTPTPKVNPCEEPAQSPLTINEVLYDPSNEEPSDTGAGLPGDANGDGVYVQDDDEFVEMVNTSGATADISGFALWDDEAWGVGEARHTFPPDTVLPPGGAVVVFGGGTPTGKFGGATIQTATGGRINLNNSNDTLRVTNAEGEWVLCFEIEPRSNDPDESYTRNPDIIGLFEQHGASTPRLFSPGTRVDGTPF